MSKPFWEFYEENKRQNFVNFRRGRIYPTRFSDYHPELINPKLEGVSFKLSVKSVE